MSARNSSSELTKREFADLFGISESQLERLFQQGMPHSKTTARKIVIPMPEGRVWFHNHLVEKGRQMGKPKSIDEARERKVQAEAELAELQLAKARDELMTADEFFRSVGDAFGRVRAKLLNLPPRIAGAAFGAETIQVCQAKVQPLVDEVIEELRRADDVESPDEDDEELPDPEDDGRDD